MYLAIKCALCLLSMLLLVDSKLVMDSIAAFKNIIELESRSPQILIAHEYTLFNDHCETVVREIERTTGEHRGRGAHTWKRR